MPQNEEAPAALEGAEALRYLIGTMYRVSRSVQVSKNPPRFEAASQQFETQSEAETAYIRAVTLEGTARVCLDVSESGGRWRALAVFALR